MAYFHINHLSETLHMLTNTVVILPDFNPAEGIQEPYPVLYLLHGFTHDCFGWLHNSCIARYANEKKIAVVLPSGYNSAYTDMYYGQNYFTFISEELPAFLNTVFPISKEANSTFVCGNSMGGYGALKWALTYPERFGGAISLSGSLHAEDRILGRSANSGNQCEGIYGSPAKIDPNTQDLFVMLRNRIREGRKLPKFSLYCSTEDKQYLYQSSLDFYAMAKEYGLSVTFDDGPGGHTFDYWDPLLPKILDWCLSIAQKAS